MLLSNFRSSETHKGALRADRKIKELQFTREEEQKNFERLNELVEKLQQKTRTYKKQIEDAEEIAALNLAKFRKAQQQLEEVINIHTRLIKTRNITNMTLSRPRTGATRQRPT